MSVTKPIKKFVYNRDNFCCRKCGGTKELQLHHVMPQRLGGPDDSFNLVTLCCIDHANWHSVEALLGVGKMEKRVVEAFYLWLKEDFSEAAAILSKVKLYNRIEKAQKTFKKRKRK